jgi:hypothetical protein
VAEVEFRLSTTVVGVGTAHQSFMSLPVAQSNTAKCQSTEELGQETSQPQAELMASFTALAVG